MPEAQARIDLATLLLSAGGYGRSDRTVGYDDVRVFAAAFFPAER